MYYETHLSLLLPEIISVILNNSLCTYYEAQLTGEETVGLIMIISHTKKYFSAGKALLFP